MLSGAKIGFLFKFSTRMNLTIIFSNIIRSLSKARVPSQTMYHTDHFDLLPKSLEGAAKVQIQKIPAQTAFMPHISKQGC
jgi:hypothetical protein